VFALAAAPLVAETLERVPSGTAAGGSGDADLRVEPLLTFKDLGGRYCREYQVVAGGLEAVEAVHGLACRQPEGGWRTEILVAGRVPSDRSFTPASTPASEAFDAAVGAMIADQPLDGDAEFRLIERGWR
jgi:hypothetical protein